MSISFDAICPSLSPALCGPDCMFKYHRDVAYSWALQPFEGPNSEVPPEFLHFTVSKQLEKEFCNPNKDLLKLDDALYNFTTMTCIKPKTEDRVQAQEGADGGGDFNFTRNAAADSPEKYRLLRFSAPPSCQISHSPHSYNGEVWAWYWRASEANDWEELVYSSEEYQKGRTQIQKFQDLEEEYHRSSPPEGKFVLELYHPQFDEEVMLSDTEDDIISDHVQPHSSVLYILDFAEMTLTKPGNGRSNVQGAGYNLGRLEVRRRPQTYSTFVEWSYLDDFSPQFTKAKINSRNWISFGDIDPAGNIAFPELPQNLLEQSYQEGKATLCSGSCEVFLDRGNLRMIVTVSERRITIKRTVHIRREVIGRERLLDISEFPPSWDPMPSLRIYTTVVVKPSSPEFESVKAKLEESVSQYDITELRRIQNPASFISYTKEKSLASDGKEMQLFHGTRRISLRTICEQNFNVDFSGHAHGTAYGRGVYFGAKAALSMGYAEVYRTKDMGASAVLFLARVIVTKTVTLSGHSNEDNSAETTVVDSLRSPQIYVKKKANTFYPEYLLFLKKR